MAESSSNPGVTPAASRPCKRCGCPLLFAPSVAQPKGGGRPAVIPLDTRSPVYAVWTDADGRIWAESAKAWLWRLQQADDPRPMLAGLAGFHPSHFTTCPEASSFSGKGKAGNPTGTG